MKKRIKAHFKLNLLSLFFIAVSFISITLAWFAYSGIARVETDIKVKAWYIQIEKDNEVVKNEVVISLDEIMPGMDTVSEMLKIQNLGDSDAELHYKIESARLLGDTKNNYIVDGIEVTSEEVEDLLSYELPFSINMSVTKNYISAHGDEAYFEVSVSWPLDSDRDELDSEWGNNAYEFLEAEKVKHSFDPTYQIRPSIQIIISVVAEQYLENEDSSDPRYNLGDEILFDVVNKQICTSVDATCIKTHVIDVNNTLGDDTVTLFPDPIFAHIDGEYDEYDSLFVSRTATWTANTRPLFIQDLIKIISKDVKDSFLIRNNLSNAIIGSINSPERMELEIGKIKKYNGYYQYKNINFDFLSSAVCYWTRNEFDDTKAFAVQKTDEFTSKIYGEQKNIAEGCKVIPVIIANKSDL